MGSVRAVPGSFAARPTTAVRARGLTKHYAGTAVVSDVDLTVHAGCVHGLVGPNGAGKTTLLALLLGLVEPDAGELHVLGRDRSEVEGGWLDGVAGMLGTPSFYPYLSGRRNLRHLARLDDDGDPSIVARVLASTGLAGAADQLVRGYSLGMRQRLGLAAVLLRSPRLIVLDEPTNGLDPAGARDLRALLRELAADGVAVLLSSHDISAVEDVCGAVTVLSAGRTAFDGTLDELRAAAPAGRHRLSTSDDHRATGLAGGLAVVAHPEGGLAVEATEPELDELVVRLGRAGVAVRGLRVEVGPLTSLLLRLTGDASAAGASR